MLELLTVPNKLLREKSIEVEASVDVKDLITGMKEWSQNRPQRAEGLKIKAIGGMAAIQFGQLVKVILLWQGFYEAIINPVITKESGNVLSLEKCFSIPHKNYWVKRPNIINVKYMNENGEIRTITGQDLLAFVLKHEIDHLDGIMIDEIGTEAE